MKRIEWFVRHQVQGQICYMPRDPATAGFSVPQAEAQAFPQRWLADEACAVLNEMLGDLLDAASVMPAEKRNRIGKWEVVEG